MNTLTWDFFKKFLFSLRAGALIRIISWMCVAGLCVGVASLVLILSVMNGFNRSIKDRKFSNEPHLVVNFGLKSVDEIKKHEAYKWLSAQQGVRFEVTENQDVVVRTKDGYVQGGIAQGVEPDSENVNAFVLPNAVLGEENDEVQDLAFKKGHAYFGFILAENLGVFEGDTVTLVAPESLLDTSSFPKMAELKVQGFIRSESEEVDQFKIYYALGKELPYLQKTSSLQRELEVRLPDPENFLGIKNRLDAYGLKVSSWQDRNANLLYSLKLEKFMVGLLLGFSTLVASFSLLTVMTLLLTQKRKDMGLLLALGESPRKLQGMILRIGMTLSGFGIFLGCAFGLTLSLLLDRYSEGFLPSVYEETNLPAEIQVGQVSLIVFLAFFISWFLIVMSTRKIKRWVPVEALKR